jgi:hypothetical protein
MGGLSGMAEGRAGSSRITFEQLADLADPTHAHLSEAQRTDLLARVQADPVATAELARLQGLIHLMRSDTAEDAPEWVVNRAARLFRQRRPQEPAGLQRLARQIVAILQFDSAQSPLAYGVRSGDALAARQLLYGGDGWVIDIHIEAAGSLWQITGQLLGGEDGVLPGQAVLHNASSAVEATLSEMSEFSLPLVGAGTFELVLRVGDLDIVVPELTLANLKDGA